MKLIVTLLMSFFLIACTGTEEEAELYTPESEAPLEELLPEPIVEPTVPMEPTSSVEPTVSPSQPVYTPSAPTPETQEEFSGTMIVNLSVDGNTESARSFGRSANTVSYHKEVHEGGTFRVRIGFTGPSPQEGGCTLNGKDSNNPNDTAGSYDTIGVYARSNGYDLTQVFSTYHDNLDDEGRTMTVSLVSCSFPDFDRRGIAYEIGNDSVTVKINSSGVVFEPDTGTYTFSVKSISWQVEPEEEWHGIQTELVTVVLSFDNLPPRDFAFWYSFDDSKGWNDTIRNYFSVSLPSSRIAGDGPYTYTGYIHPYTTPEGQSRTFTFTLKEVKKSPVLCWPNKPDWVPDSVNCTGASPYWNAPGGTYKLGSEKSKSITITGEPLGDRPATPDNIVDLQ